MAMPGGVLARAILGLAIALGILLVIETTLALLTTVSKDSASQSAELRNEHDPSARAVVLGMPAGEALGEMLLFNIRSNELTYPDPDLLFRVRPNFSGEPIHGYTGINAEGFRGRIPDRAEAQSHRSILLLGDSCAFGWGIRKYPLTFAAILEKSLQKADPDFRLYNLSQPGYSTAQARVLYENWSPLLDPEIVVLYLGWNDLWPAGHLDDAEAMIRTRRLDTPILGVIRNSHLYRFIESGLRRWDTESLTPNDMRGEGPPARRRVAGPDSLANLRFIVDDARGRGARVIVVVPPYVSDWIQRPGIDQIGQFNEALQREFEAEVEFENLSDMMPENPDRQRLFMLDGYHPSPLGARIIARELDHKIRRDGSPKSRSD